MGFGTLFIGYVLLLNIGYYAYTDLLAALLMALGLSRLARWCRPFLIGTVLSILFALIGGAELFFEFSELFAISLPAAATAALSCARYITVGVLSVFVLFGIRSLAREVGLAKLASRCEYTFVSALVLYLCSALLEIPGLFSGLDPASTALIAGVVLLLTFFIGCVNLHTIYTAYARICMPEDADMAERPSRFGFVNEYRAKKAAREREVMEERMRLQKERMAKKTQKRKKK